MIAIQRFQYDRKAYSLCGTHGVAYATHDTLLGYGQAEIAQNAVCLFFVTGQIYVDKQAGEEIRASAQGFITLVTYGFGLGIGSVLAGQVVDAFTLEGVKDWTTIWWVPSMFALGVLMLFALIFRDNGNKSASVESSGTA